MNELPDATAEAERLVGKAAEDVAAFGLAAPHPVLASIACFHAQQAIEKMGKAALVMAWLPYPRGHDIGALAGLMPEDLGPLRAALARHAWLTLHATGSRYGEGITASPDDVTAARDGIAQVAEVLARTCGLVLPVLPLEREAGGGK